MSNLKPNITIKRQWLKDLRNEKKISIRKIAPMLGVSWQHYSDIENGKRNPSIELSKTMATFFGVSIDLFFEDRVDFKQKEAQ